MKFTSVCVFLLLTLQAVSSQEKCRRKTGGTRHALDCLDFTVICNGDTTRISWSPNGKQYCHSLDWGYDCYEQSNSSSAILQSHSAFGEYYSISGSLRISGLPVSSKVYCVFFACVEQYFDYYPLPSSATVTCSAGAMSSTSASIPETVSTSTLITASSTRASNSLSTTIASTISNSIPVATTSHFAPAPTMINEDTEEEESSTMY